MFVCMLLLLYLLQIIICTKAQCIDGDLRFVEEGTDRGPLLICFRSLWHETCSSSFNEVDARIACRQLGFVEGRIIGHGQNIRFGLLNVSFTCGGYEEAITNGDCVNTTSSTCTGNRYVRIQCYNGYISFLPIVPGVSATTIAQTSVGTPISFSLPNNISIPFGNNKFFTTGYVYPNGLVSIGGSQIMTDFVDLEMSSTENPHNVIVPLLLPSDIPMGVEGQIYNMEDAMDTRPFTPVDTFIRNATGKSFSSEVLIKVKWEEITTANEELEFQLIIASNFNSTYAIITHACIEQIRMRPLQAKMGYSLANHTHELFRYSNTPFSHEIACINFPVGVRHYTVIYNLISSEQSSRQSDMTCSSAGLTQCCQPFQNPTVSCRITNEHDDVCYCDSLCYRFNDCCDDVASDGLEIPCVPVCESDTVNFEGTTYNANGPVTVCINGLQRTFRATSGPISLSTQFVICQQIINQITSIGPNNAIESQQSIRSFFSNSTNVSCNGIERTIQECTADIEQMTTLIPNPIRADCKDIIRRNDSMCTNGIIRIDPLDTNTTSRGVAQICINGQWTVVCSPNVGFDICYLLGYSNKHVTVEYRPQTVMLGITSLSCIEGATTLRNCSISVGNCSVAAFIDCNSIATSGSFPIAGAVAIAIAIFLIILIPCIVVVIIVAVKVYHHKKSKVKTSLHPSTLSLNSLDTEKDSSRYIYQHPLLRKMTMMIDTEYLKNLMDSGLIISNDSLRMLDCIGQGEFGLVYKAHLFDDAGIPTYVAVKTLKGSYSQDEVNELLTESFRMKQLSHPNVMGLIGNCVDAGPAPYIVLPYMAGGSLLSYLKKNRDNLLLTGDRADERQEVETRLLSMCLQIARGMQYISSQNMIHRDLAARNCMIDFNGIIKVSDFGLSKNLYEKMYFRQDKTEGVKLPVKWMAIESINDGIFSQKTDVWSFGITCWEIFSGGKTPFGGINPMNLPTLLEEGQRLNKPNNNACTSSYDTIIVPCWSASPDERPTFNELVTTIETTLTSMADYLDFNQFSLGKQEEVNNKTADEDV